MSRTFCRRCAHDVLSGTCPNRGGNLVQRAIRPAGKLQKYPASTNHVLKPEGCRKVA
jgi:hypothetical protein